MVVIGWANDCCIVTFDGSRKLTSTYWRTGADRFSRAFYFCTAVSRLSFTVISSVTISLLLVHQVLWKSEI